MWVMKYSIPYNKNNLIGNLTKKYEITIIGYPLTHSLQKEKLEITTSGIFIGEEKNIKKFCNQIIKDKRTINFEYKKNYAIMHNKQNIVMKHLFQPKIVHIKPIIVTKHGEYIFEIGSWDKKELINIISNYSNNKYQGKLHWIKNKKTPRIQVYTPFPNLSPQQHKCLQIAIENSYYNYPRGTKLEKLAQIAKISLSTFQFHLRNAEKKVMPFLKT